MYIYIYICIYIYVCVCAWLSRKFLSFACIQSHYHWTPSAKARQSSPEVTRPWVPGLTCVALAHTEMGGEKC